MGSQNEKKEALKDLQLLSNIGQALAGRLYSVGIKTAKQVRMSNPERIYEKLRQKEGGKLDKCVLYALKGAILNIPWWECKSLKMVLSQNK